MWKHLTSPLEWIEDSRAAAAERRWTVELAAFHSSTALKRCKEWSWRKRSPCRTVTVSENSKEMFWCEATNNEALRHLRWSHLNRSKGWRTWRSKLLRLCPLLCSLPAPSGLCKSRWFPCHHFIISIIRVRRMEKPVQGNMEKCVWGAIGKSSKINKVEPWDLFLWPQ